MENNNLQIKILNNYKSLTEEDIEKRKEMLEK